MLEHVWLCIALAILIPTWLAWNIRASNDNLVLGRERRLFSGKHVCVILFNLCPDAKASGITDSG